MLEALRILKELLLVFSLCWNPEEAGEEKYRNGVDELVSKIKDKWARRKQSFFRALLSGLHQKVWFKLRVGLPASNNLIKKIPPRNFQWLG